MKGKVEPLERQRLIEEGILYTYISMSHSHIQNLCSLVFTPSILILQMEFFQERI